MLGWHGYFTIIVVFGMFVALAKEIMHDSITVFAAVVLLWDVGVINTSDALSGFSNAGMITVGAILVIVKVVEDTGIVIRLTRLVFGKTKLLPLCLLRMQIVCTLISGFTNNTPLMAIMTPAVREWARMNKVSPSKLLIPLSYAVIAGGMCTVIGTSTNLVVQGLLLQDKKDPFGFFELAYVSLPVSIFAFVFMDLVGYRWLPSDRGGDLIGETQQHASEFLTEIFIGEECAFIGGTVESAKEKLNIVQGNIVEILREISPSEDQILSDSSPRIEISEHEIEMTIMNSPPPSVDNISLVGVWESDNADAEGAGDSGQLHLTRTAPVFGRYNRISPVLNRDILQARDRLIFSGNVEIFFGMKRVRGVTQMDVDVSAMTGKGVAFYELIISHRNPMLFANMGGVTAQALGEYYGVAVVASRIRESDSSSRNLSAVTLSPGDTVLVIGKPDFYEKFRSSPDFYMVTTAGAPIPPFSWRSVIPLAIFLAMMVLAAVEVAPIEMLSVTAAVFLVVLKFINGAKAVESIDWALLLMIGASFALGKALDKSGVAEAVGVLIKSANMGPWLANFVLLGFGIIITEILTNNAAAAVCFPLAVQIAKQLDVNYQPFVMSVIVGSNAGFAVPFGYATHLMAYSAAGYKFKDFLAVGIVTDLIYLGGSALLIPLLWPF